MALPSSFFETVAGRNADHTVIDDWLNEPRDDDFVRWLSTGGHRSNGPLMTSNGANVLFVGGPWDGQRKVMDHLPERFYVDSLIKVSDDIDMKSADGKANDGPIQHQRVAYAKIPALGQIFYKSMPSKDWRRFPTNELGVELFKGYKNLP